MATLTTLALTAYIVAHQCVSPKLADAMVAIAQQESSLNQYAVHDNFPPHTQGRGYFPATLEEAQSLIQILLTAGHTSLDVGLTGINTVNFEKTGLTFASAFDVCRNMHAGAVVLFSKYNGNPPTDAYAESVLAHLGAPGASPPPRRPPAAPLAAPVVSRPSPGRELVASNSKG